MSKTDWKEDYKQMKLLDKRQLELLDKGPNSLSSSWSLMAMYNDWKRIRGISDEHP
tara:strand:- start:3005 stop:3172 length:168 start_codon:yes stop_codon:yes gene_type:complete